MRIAELAHKDGNASGNRWRSESDGNVRRIWHYSTLMLQFNKLWPSDENVLDYSTGHGSKSDQDGMNVLFRELNLPLYFSRAGGAEVVKR